MIEINWAYIAGFTDGEGCIHWIQRHNQWAISISQAINPDSDVLNDIKEFLKSQHISCGVSFHPATKPNHRDIQTLRIVNAYNVHAFLINTLPFLRVKRAKAIVAIEFNAVVLRRIAMRKERLEEAIEKATIDYRAGQSIWYVTRTYKVAAKTLYKHFHRIGLPRRTQREAIAQYWGIDIKDLKHSRQR